jgi:DNA-binding phage protein
LKEFAKELLIHNQSALCEKKNLDKEDDMRYINRMDIGKTLRELIIKEGKSLRRTSIDLHIDRASLQRSLGHGANPEWGTIKKVLDYLGYEIMIVKSRKKAKRAKG